MTSNRWSHKKNSTQTQHFVQFKWLVALLNNETTFKLNCDSTAKKVRTKYLPLHLVH